MPLFAVIGLDDPARSATIRAEQRGAHRAYFRSRAGAARFAGAFYGDDGGQCGTFLLFEAESIAALTDWYREEPFFKAGLYREFRILDFRVALDRIDCPDWDPAFPTQLLRSTES